MAELNISNRIIFEKKGEQKLFLNKVKNSLGVTNEKIARTINVNQRTLTDWKREKMKMSYKSAFKLSKLSGISLPKSAYEEKWGGHLKDVSIKGGLSRVGKDGRVKVNEKDRKIKWKKWWNKKGKFKKHPIINNPFPINKPKFSSDLAEFVGIILGDGHLNKNQLKITLHKIDDRKFGDYIIGQAEKLFNVPVKASLRESSKSTDYLVSRTELVKFCVIKIGLKTGDKVKNQVDVPRWIKNSKNFSKACVRGLVDTDGCVVIHEYKSSSKKYKYKKLTFTNKSKPLIIFVCEVLNSNGVKARIYKDCEVWIDSKKDINEYMKIFGSHNPKHLNRYAK